MFVKGKCEDMCSEAEIEMRERLRLLHGLEVKHVENGRRYVANRSRMVACFRRAAAGRETLRSSDLRTPQALQETINFLFYDVALIETKPWHWLYSYIDDRVMAVRQEMVMQQISRCYGVSLLQPIVRFYAFAAYRLCESKVDDFDPVINRRNLQECLKKLLVLYDEFDDIESRVDSIKQNGDAGYNRDDFEALYKNCREFFEALYVLFNLGARECIERALSIPRRWRGELLTLAVQISLCWRRNNWKRLCRLVEDLPHFLSAVTALHLPMIRRKALETMAVAYTSRNLTYPIKSLCYQLMYGSDNDVVKDCLHYGLKCTNDSIIFQKADFKHDVKTTNAKREMFVEHTRRRELDASVILVMEYF